MHFGFKVIVKQNISKSLDTSAHNLAGFVYTSKTSATCFQFYYYRNKNFEKDKLFFETDELIAGIDGVILNLDLLKKTYVIDQWQDLFLFLYKKYQENIAQHLCGVYCGFLFEKQTEKLIYFTNHCATKKVYYHQSDKGFIITSSLKQISKYLISKGQHPELDKTAAYSLLTYGGMYKNRSLMRGVYRLHGGEMLRGQGTQLRLSKFYDYNATTIRERPEKAIIDDLEATFRLALKLEYQKDIAYGHRHLATLSGGLDSRMNVFLAAKEGYEVSNLCFSQSNYADERIARAIAKKLKQEIYFVPLDGGKYVFDYEENMNIYEGQIFYPSSAHFNFSIKKIDLSGFGLIHSGLLGDGILGTHISRPISGSPDLRAKLISKKLFPKIEKPMEQLGKEYCSEDIFNLHQRFFNFIASGAWAMERFKYLVSPFLYPDFLEICLQIPAHYKYRQSIYIKWINRYHPEMTQFVWETTGMRPRYSWQQQISPYTKKAIALWYRIRGKGHQLNMTPYQYWYENDPDMQRFMQTVFDQEIAKVEGDPELWKDANFLFKSGNAIEKTLVMTLLGAVELLNIRV